MNVTSPGCHNSLAQKMVPEVSMQLLLANPEILPDDTGIGESTREESGKPWIAWQDTQQPDPLRGMESNPAVLATDSGRCSRAEVFLPQDTVHSGGNQ